MNGADLRAFQEAFLLLQILGEPERRIALGPANKALGNASNRSLGLAKAGPANKLREALADEGLLVIEKVRTPKGGNTKEFVLTDAGLARLHELPQYPGELRIPGRAIDRLRVSLLERSEVSRVLQEGSSTENIAEVVMEVVESLHRERHWESGMIPIHEVREQVRARLPAFSNHANLDPVIKGLWKQERIGLVPISDKSTASERQLRDSIPGVGQILFYAEVRP